MTNTQKNLTAFLIFIITFAPLLLLRGYVIVTLWDWFLSGVYQLPVGAGEVAGVLLLITLLRDRKPKGDQDPFNIVKDKVILSLLFSLFSLFFGWIIKLFI